jgi:hypothetical protein
VATQGSTTIDFGTSGNDYVETVVTGQAWVTGTTDVEAYFMAEATSDNDAQAHALAANFVKLTVGALVAGTGFTIFAVCDDACVTGQFTVRWVGN